MSVPNLGFWKEPSKQNEIIFDSGVVTGLVEKVAVGDKFCFCIKPSGFPGKSIFCGHCLGLCITQIYTALISIGFTRAKVSIHA